MAHNMSIGELGSPDTTFVRKFRWLLESDGLPKHFAKSVKINYCLKRIDVEYYDVFNGGTGMHAMLWADRLKDEPKDLKFTTLDGCGNGLYQVVFSGLELIDHTSEFDYADSNVSTTNLSVRYKACEKKLLAVPNTFTRYHWQLVVDDEVVHVECENRPSLNVEETEVNFLNQTTFIPGQAKWNTLRLKSPYKSKTVEGKLNCPDFPCLLQFCKNDQPVSTYILTGCHIPDYHPRAGGEVEFSIKFDGIKFEAVE